MRKATPNTSGSPHSQSPGFKLTEFGLVNVKAGSSTTANHSGSRNNKVTIDLETAKIRKEKNMRKFLDFSHEEVKPHDRSPNALPPSISVLNRGGYSSRTPQELINLLMAESKIKSVDASGQILDFSDSRLDYTHAGSLDKSPVKLPRRKLVYPEKPPSNYSTPLTTPHPKSGFNESSVASSSESSLQRSGIQYSTRNGPNQVEVTLPEEGLDISITLKSSFTLPEPDKGLSSRRRSSTTTSHQSFKTVPVASSFIWTQNQQGGWSESKTNIGSRNKVNVQTNASQTSLSVSTPADNAGTQGIRLNLFPQKESTEAGDIVSVSRVLPELSPSNIRFSGFRSAFSPYIRKAQEGISGEVKPGVTSKVNPSSTIYESSSSNSSTRDQLISLENLSNPKNKSSSPVSPHKSATNSVNDVKKERRVIRILTPPPSPPPEEDVSTPSTHQASTQQVVPEAKTPEDIQADLSSVSSSRNITSESDSNSLCESRILSHSDDDTFSEVSFGSSDSSNSSGLFNLEDLDSTKGKRGFNQDNTPKTKKPKTPLASEEITPDEITPDYSPPSPLIKPQPSQSKTPEQQSSQSNTPEPQQPQLQNLATKINYSYGQTISSGKIVFLSKSKEPIFYKICRSAYKEFIDRSTSFLKVNPPSQAKSLYCWPTNWLTSCFKLDPSSQTDSENYLNKREKGLSKALAMEYRIKACVFCAEKDKYKFLINNLIKKLSGKEFSIDNKNVDGLSLKIINLFGVKNLDNDDSRNDLALVLGGALTLREKHKENPNSEEINILMSAINNLGTETLSNSKRKEVESMAKYATILESDDHQTIIQGSPELFQREFNRILRNAQEINNSENIKLKKSIKNEGGETQENPTKITKKASGNKLETVSRDRE